MLKPLDVIELRVAVDSWEPGTVATVLEVMPASVLAEVSDDDGRTLEILTVPAEAARLVDSDEDVPSRPPMSEDVRGDGADASRDAPGAVRPRRQART